MQQDSETSPGNNGRQLSLAQEARRLVAANRRGVLSTLIAGEGVPYGSLVDLAPLPDGNVIMFLSTLAVHRQYLAEDPRASIFIAPSFAEEDALAQARVTLVGRVTAVADRQSVAGLYLARHPNAQRYINFPDFQFFRLEVEKARYIAGFGRMGWIPGDRYRAVSPDNAWPT
jgi:putative heme iron utilization protein